MAQVGGERLRQRPGAQRQHPVTADLGQDLHHRVLGEFEIAP